MGGEERRHDLGESEGKDCNGDFLPDSLENVTLKGRSHTGSAWLRERVAQCISTVELTHTLRCAAVNDPLLSRLSQTPFSPHTSALSIGGSKIFLEKGDFGNPNERSERALRGSGLTGKEI